MPGVIVLPSVSGELPEKVVTTTASGFSPDVIYLDTTPEFYGAKRDGVTDDTIAFQEANNAVAAKGGGTVRVSDGTYVVDGLIWGSTVHFEGRGRGTILKAKAGSVNPGMIMIAEGRVRYGGWKNMVFLPNGNVNQDCFYLFARESGVTNDGGVWNCIFESLEIGRNGVGEAWERNCMWFRGGIAGSNILHQYNDFRNVQEYHTNTGATATTSRGFKASGSCEKFSWDQECLCNGAKANEKVGTNREFTREFLLSTSLTIEALVNTSVITVGSVAGLEANKKFLLGEGHFGEVLTVETILGKEVTIKGKLAFTHALGSNLYLLSGTVAEPTELAPKFMKMDGGALQNADTQLIVDTGCLIVNLYGTDFEQSNRGYKVRGGAYQINALSIRPLNAASEGISNGSGTLTVGSAVITAVTGVWVEGDLINGAGIVPGTTVSEVKGGGTELKLSAPVTANGTVGATEKVPLQKGGKGVGYVASYEEGSSGTVTYHPNGALDLGVVGNLSGVRVRDLSRGTAVLTQNSKGVVLPLASSVIMNIFSVHKIELINAAAAIKWILGTHGTGEITTFRASTAATTFESGGNILLPGGLKLILQPGDFAIFQRTDSGSLTWECISVQRAEEMPFSVGAGSLLAPVWGESLTISAEPANTTPFKAVLQRAIVRKSGLLDNIYIGTGTVIAGNIRAAVYDVGQKEPGHYSILWQGANVASAGEGKWLSMGKPELLIPRGKEIAIAFMSDSVTAKFGQWASHTSVNLDELPASFENAGLKMQTMGFHQYAELKYESLAELTNGGVPWAVIGHIT